MINEVKRFKKLVHETRHSKIKMAWEDHKDAHTKILTVSFTDAVETQVSWEYAFEGGKEYLGPLSHSLFLTFMKYMGHYITSAPPRYVPVHRLKAVKPNDHLLETMKLSQNKPF